jgi:hypothetical protein
MMAIMEGLSEDRCLVAGILDPTVTCSLLFSPWKVRVLHAQKDNAYAASQ